MTRPVDLPQPKSTRIEVAIPQALPPYFNTARDSSNAILPANILEPQARSKRARESSGSADSEGSKNHDTDEASSDELSDDSKDERSDKKVQKRARQCKPSAADKKIKNREAQRRTRLRRKRWENFPPAFKAIFQDSKAAQKKVLKARFYDRTSSTPTKRLSWSTGTPTLIPAQECFAQGPPSLDSLWESILHALKPDDRVTVLANTRDDSQEPEKMRWRRATIMLLKEIGRDPEDVSKISAVMDFPLPSQDIELYLPDRFGRDITTPALANTYKADLIFRNEWKSFTTHYGYASITALAPGCEKVWFIAPPREANLLLLTPELDLLECIKKLQSMVVMRQTCNDVLFLPPGVLYASFTVKTGLAYGSVFRTRQNIYGATVSLARLIDGVKNQEGWIQEDDIVKTWIETLESIAQFQDKEELIEASYALNLKDISRLRKEAAFRAWGLKLEEVIGKHYPDVQAVIVDTCIN